MRFPLIMTLIILLIGFVTDLLIYKSICRVGARPVWRKLYAVTSVLFALFWVVLICLPKRSGSNGSFERLMWCIYTYAAFYIPKYIYVVFDLIAGLPRLWHGKRLRWLSGVGLGIALIVMSGMWWGALVERYIIDVERVDVAVDNLPEAFDGMTIAQISDLHVGTFGSDTVFVHNLVDEVNALHPDLIVFTGDIVNRHTSELEPFVGPLSRLKSPYGVISILGNHDYGDYSDWPSDAAKADNFARLVTLNRMMGWRLLNNESIAIDRGGDSLIVIGVENVGDPPFRTYGDLRAAYPALSDSLPKVLLSHNPAHWENDICGNDSINIALTLSGHTHAMQIKLFGWSPAAMRYRYWGGLYDDGGKHNLYVNIGSGEVAIPARIGATPEVTLLTLKTKRP